MAAGSSAAALAEVMSMHRRRRRRPHRPRRRRPRLSRRRPRRRRRRGPSAATAAHRPRSSTARRTTPTPRRRYDTKVPAAAVLLSAQCARAEVRCLRGAHTTRVARGSSRGRGVPGTPYCTPYTLRVCGSQNREHFFAIKRKINLTRQGQHRDGSTVVRVLYLPFTLLRARQVSALYRGVVHPV